ncbi:MAG: CBS domain-containing protein [Polyangiaceae bacterium]|nr:CBS domain-containing protein [Polyangiaceae bacterium]
MELVVTHAVADFDALGAAVGAHLLYPRSRILLGPLGAGPRELVAVHRDRLPIVEPAEIDVRAVRRVIIVDVRRAKRLALVPGLLERIQRRDGIEVHVWDHHGPSEDDVHADQAIIEPVGSATTLLVEALQRRQIPFGPMEATVMALGVHVDTGSLTFGGSTGRDAAALGWLMNRGAALSVINRYLRPPFGDSQREALRVLLANMTVEKIGGARVGFAVLDHPSGRLDEVVSEALALEDVHALFVIVPDGRSGACVIARSRARFVDVAHPVAHLGGGGHPVAAAATCRGLSPADARARLLHALRNEPPKPLKVADIMSSPVATVGTKTPLAHAKEVLVHGGFTGVPVVKDERVVGMLSRRDLAKAERKDELDRPVRKVMSAPVCSTTEDELVEEALATMEQADVGRLPVLRGERLVGIVTRDDLLAFLYGEAPPSAR